MWSAIRRKPWWPWLPFVGTIALGIPAVAARISEPHMAVEAETVLFGIGILSAAFLLGAGAEAAQHDIPASLSLAVIAFIAVLPEYAVDLLFAWRAGTDPEQAQFAIANMTGGNRLLLGVGWAFVLFLFAWKASGTDGLLRGARKALRQPIAFVRGGGEERVLTLPKTISLEVSVLGLATLYSFLIPLKGSINLIDTVILIALFAWYLRQLMKHPIEEPDLEGPAEVLANLPRRRRRFTVVLILAYAAGLIVASAEPFADGLIESGSKFGIDEFLLVQWVAPLASESPEFLAALYLVWRGLAAQGMTTLISSKVNQWTLLIASLPIAFSISGGTLDGLPMDSRQQEEVFLTAAQSLFGVLLILDKRLTPRAGLLLFGLFAGQFLLTDSTIRVGFAITYLVLAAGLLAQRWRQVPTVVREAVRSDVTAG